MNGLQENFHAQFNENDGLVANFGDVQVVHTDDYNDLFNKPKINDVTVQGEKISADYHLQDKMDEATVAEIEAILYID
jgi:hypothetical protein